MVVLLFYKCTNISCSDEHLFYIALIEALELQAVRSLDPLAKSFARRSRVGYGQSAVGRDKRSGCGVAGCQSRAPTLLPLNRFWWTLADVLRKIRARLVADFVPGLLFRINLNVAAKMASQKCRTCFQKSYSFYAGFML